MATRERPSTEEQRRRYEANRCKATAPEVKEGAWRQASERRCMRKGGHEGPHKIDFGWTQLCWETED